MQGSRSTRWMALTRAVLMLLVVPLFFVSGAAVAQNKEATVVQNVPAGTQMGAGQQPGAAQGQPAEIQRQVTQPYNNAPVWRDVRSGETNLYTTTQVRGRETNVLIQSEGEMWRRVRNGPITVYGGWLVVLVFVSILVFYWMRGEITLHEPRTGRQIVRFTAWERFVHWTTAIAFVILAFSGIFMLFGRYVLLPIFGYTLFSWLAVFAKNAHNFVAPVFFFALPVMFVLFVRDNILQSGDMKWLARFGGLFSKDGHEPPSWRFNMGEKVLFWLMVSLVGAILAFSGVVMLFPNAGQGREVMQVANVVHLTGAIIMICLATFHIYLGTLGMKGAYEAMRTGYVDETWAKEHHELWYDQVKAGTARQHFADDAPADVKAQVEQALKA